MAKRCDRRAIIGQRELAVEVGMTRRGSVGERRGAAEPVEPRLAAVGRAGRAGLYAAIALGFAGGVLVFALGPAYAAGERSADLAATITEGVEAIEPYLARYLPQRALVALVPLAILAAVIPIDWKSGLVLAVSAPLIPLFMVLAGEKAEAINQQQWHQLRAMSAHLLDAV
ncbi:MAG: hypothetical protein M0002_08025 [Rhodospirillales bacterium]|nr:hypothetical protein [Rhodospirillales bacterium]